MGKISLVIADDHELFRAGFKASLEEHPDIIVSGEAHNGIELVSLTKVLKPDIVLTDIKMPRLNGVEATAIITKKYPFAVVLAFTSYSEDHFIQDMLQAGARGYLLKDASKKEVVEAIYAVHGNKTYFSESIKKRAADLSAGTGNKVFNKISFSEREKAIIALICNQYSSKGISKVLFISVRTVDGHRDRIMRKMNASNIVGIVTFAVRHGMFEP